LATARYGGDQNLKRSDLRLLNSLFGLWPHVSALTAISALPIVPWKFSLGVWLVAKGFKPSPVTDGCPCH
jgi:hypothetical protein